MVVLVLLVLCNMVVSCFAIDCASRYTKGSGVGFFFRFPVDPARHRLWISAIRRRKADGSTWVPSKWDRVCGRHFQSGRPHPEAAHPDFTPNVQLGYPTSSSLSVRETSLQEEARQGSSESPPLVSPRIRRSERARERCRRPRLCLLSRRANATGKLEWRWQRCVRTLSSIIYMCTQAGQPGVARALALPAEVCRFAIAPPAFSLPDHSIQRWKHFPREKICSSLNLHNNSFHFWKKVTRSLKSIMFITDKRKRAKKNKPNMGNFNITLPLRSLPGSTQRYRFAIGRPTDELELFLLWTFVGLQIKPFN